MQLRGRDVEQWMSHRRLPEDLRRYEKFYYFHKSKLPHFLKLLHPLLLLVTLQALETSCYVNT